MEILMLIFVFIFGTIIGSFLNVVIYRYNSGTSPLTGRSRCFSCAKTLSWKELFPIASFLVSRGRCAQCSVRISWQYLIVEALSGTMFVLVFLLNKGNTETVFLLAIFSVLLVIAVYDLRHQIIPDGLAALFAIFGLLKFFFEAGIQNIFHFPFAWTIIAGPLLFVPFWALWFVSKGRWIGLGDGKLSLGIGWFLGVTLGGSAVVLAFWIGAAFALTVMAVQKIIAIWCNEVTGAKPHLSMKSEVPFGPFLILAVFIVYFTGINFFDGSTTFFSLL